MRKFVVILVALAFVCGLPSPSIADSRNTYRVVGIGEYVSSISSPFTIEVEGDVPVCSMTFEGTTRTAPPWNFIYETRHSALFVEIHTCDGDIDWVLREPKEPWQFRRTSTLSYGFGGSKQEIHILVYSRVDEAARVEITDPGGKVVDAGSVPAQGEAQFSVVSKLKKYVSTYKAVVTGGTTGISMEFPFLVTYKWSVLDDMSIEAPASTYPRCTRVFWFYDHSLAPKTTTSARMHKDIRDALAKVSAASGISYVEAASRDELPTENWLLIDWDWKKSSYPGASAVGGPEGKGGVIHMNPRSWLIRSDQFSGLGLVSYRSSSVAGRGWIIVHETLHTLGLGHVPNRDQIMFPAGGRMTKLGDGDLAGLRYLYSPQSCQRAAA